MIRRYPKLSVLVFGLLALGLISLFLAKNAESRYEEFTSRVIKDRHGDVLRLEPNTRGLYTISLEQVPEQFRDLLIEKEDRFFYYHPGINPVSIFRGSGASTITQQLAKILLSNENNRTVTNKIQEAAYALSLEFWKTKDEILLMYLNTAYFGRQAEGLGEAARYYFGKTPDELTRDESLSLIATLGKPGSRYPGTPENSELVKNLTPGEIEPDLSARYSPRKSSDGFEVGSLKLECEVSCTTTLDKKLTSSLREIVDRNLRSPGFASAKNAAVVVIKIPENELLAVVGTPDPISEENGHQINMAVQPRPIGSTIKPFIYLKAFEKGARPYSLVDDRQYAYPIGTGFSIYPKNFDGIYRGLVTLHSALVNSLNVPAVKTLEYITPKLLYELLQKDLLFKPISPLETYDLGIALGALEMDLLTLSHYFTAFPNGGVIKPLKTLQSGGRAFIPTPMESDVIPAHRIAPESFVELVTKVISDRETAVDQFGLAGNLNLPYKNYAVKTGTSRDFHDSWTIGYTPDFLVGAWVGNHDNTPMKEVSGQNGAGKIWHEAMGLLYASEYNKNTPFSFKHVEEYGIEGNLEFGLKDDDVESARQELLKYDKALITSPHQGDAFELIKGTTIPLHAKQSGEWLVNGKTVGFGKEVLWKPERIGTYSIEVRVGKETETITVTISAGN